MQNLPINSLFIITLILSTIISITSNSWLGVWIGLEINLLSFIPLIGHDSNSTIETSSINYFIVQTIGSITILTTFLISMINSSISFNSTILSIIAMAITINIGGPPFHFWFPEVIENLSWNNCMLIITWQNN